MSADTRERLVPPPGPEDIYSVEQVRRRPLQLLARLTAEYGDVVRYRTPGLAATLLNHPRHVQHVLATRADNYTKEGTPDLMMLRPMLGESLMTVEDAVWREQRHALQPSFGRRSVSRYGDLMVTATRVLVESWRRRPDPAEPVDLAGELTELTLRVVAEALFGYDATRSSGRFGAAVQALNETMGHAGPLDAALIARFGGALATVRRVVDEVIATQPADGGRDVGLPADGARDVGLIVAAERARLAGADSDEQVRDQVLTFLLAGHETTAKALGWTLYLLARSPECSERLTAEVDAALGGRPPTVVDLDAMPYAWQVLQESMRLFPPIWIVSRMAKEDDVVGGYLLPGGSLACMSPYLLHRHPDFWPQPDRFDPERFAPGTTVGSSSAYLPFGGGPRQCIGRHFAAMEMRLVLATLLQACRFAVAPGHPVEPEALVTLRPRNGLRLRVDLRDT